MNASVLERQGVSAVTVLNNQGAEIYLWLGSKQARRRRPGKVDSAAIVPVQTQESTTVSFDGLIQDRRPAVPEKGIPEKVTVVSALDLESGAKTRQTIVDLRQIRVAVGHIDRPSHAHMATGRTVVRIIANLADVNCDGLDVAARRQVPADSVVKRCLEFEMVGTWKHQVASCGPGRVRGLSIQGGKVSSRSIRIPSDDISDTVATVPPGRRVFHPDINVIDGPNVLRTRVTIP